MSTINEYISFNFISFLKFEGQKTFLWKITLRLRRTLNWTKVSRLLFIGLEMECKAKFLKFSKYIYTCNSLTIITYGKNIYYQINYDVIMDNRYSTLKAPWIIDKVFTLINMNNIIYMYYYIQEKHLHISHNVVTSLNSVAGSLYLVIITLCPEIIIYTEFI